MTTVYPKSANLQGQDFSGKFGVLSAGRVSDDQLVAPTANGLCMKNKCEFGLSQRTTITSAQVLALNTTGITVVTAPGAGYSVLVNKFAIYSAGGTVAYVIPTTADNFTLKYTNVSGAQCAGVISTTGFMDQTTAQIRYVNPVAAATTTAASIAPVDNAPVVLTVLAANLTTGNYPISVIVFYDIVPSEF